MRKYSPQKLEELKNKIESKLPNEELSDFVRKFSIYK